MEHWHHEESPGDQKVLGHLEWFSGDLHEVKLNAHLKDASKEHFCSFQDQHFLLWLIFLSEEEEKVILADQEIPTFQDEETWPRQALLQLEDLRLPDWPHISPCTDRASGH